MNLIACVNNNWGIGNIGELLFHLPEDMKYFKLMTYGCTIIYGRKTMEGFPGGRPLPGRNNIVITKNLLNIPKSVEDELQYSGTVCKFNYPGKGEDSGATIVVSACKMHDDTQINRPIVATNLYSVTSIKDAITMANILEVDTRKIWICGGASIYEQLLPYCSFAYITKVYSDKEADAFIPNLDKLENWELVKESRYLLGNFHNDEEGCDYSTGFIYHNKDFPFNN